MEWLQLITLALVQGITEIMPISSSGHLAIVSELAGWPDQGQAFDAVLHLGTFAAMVIFFRRDWSEIIRGVFGGKQALGGEVPRNFHQIILLAIIPAGLVGFFTADFFNQIRNLQIIAVMFLAMAILIVLATHYFDNEKKRLKDIGFFEGLGIGVAQVLGLIAGISRSGVTIVAGLYNGLKREAAVRFSFILGAPLTLAAGLYSLVKFLVRPETFDTTQLLVGLGIAFVAGYISLMIFMRVVALGRFRYFAYYLLLLAFGLMLFSVFV